MAQIQQKKQLKLHKQPNMKLITTKTQMRDYAAYFNLRGIKVGFVPTLGCLHAGHVDLMRRARHACDIVVVSVFVNPLQFRKDKFEVYPRQFNEDARIAAQAGVDLLFAPELSDMYPSVTGNALFAWQDDETSRSYDEFQKGGMLEPAFVRVPGRLCDKMDGILHPWHYDGVATVVYKLFTTIGACTSYFGEKDPQQLAVIENLVATFTLPVSIERVATLRHEDGLPYSSRNTLLSPAQRAVALKVSQSVKSATETGEKSAPLIQVRIKQALAGLPDFELHYLGIVHPFSLNDVDEVCEGAILYIAFSIDGIRLTDNHRF